MKRVGNLFEKTFSMDCLYAAYEDARRGKRGKRAVLDFERHLGRGLQRLHDTIVSGEYSPEPYHTFMVYEPKERMIYAPAFADVVVQHAIYRQVYYLFDRSFISTSFACRKGYGTHAAADYVQRSLRACDGEDYYLQLDIRKFFYTIDRSVLRGQVERKIKDRRMVDIMMLFAEYDSPVGIPIGNLLSQVYALIYLNQLDHFIKRDLGVKHYVRYVDDFVLFGLDRQQALDLRLLIIDFLRDELHLELSKTTIQKVRKGINFCGYRTWRSCRVIRKYSLFKFRRRVMSGDVAAAVSLLGHARRTQSLQYMLNITREAHNAVYTQLPESYRQIHNVLAVAA